MVDDNIYWNLTCNGKFSLNSAYNSYFPRNPETPNMNWIWRTPCNQREKLFL